MPRITVVLIALIAVLLSLAAPTGAQAPTPPEKPAVTQQAGVAPPTAQPARPPLTAEEKALLAVEEEGRAEVEELVKSMNGLPDGPALRALQRKVEEVKQSQRVRFLRVKVQFARQRGDLAGAREAERMIEFILNPPKPAPAGVTRPAPEAAKAKEGGRP